MQLQPRWIITRGPAYGVTQPALLIAVRLQPSQSPQWERLQEWLAKILPEQAALVLDTQEEPARLAVRLALHWACGIQQMAGLPILATPQLLSFEPQGQGGVLLRVALPAINSPTALQALHWAVDSFCALTGGGAAVLGKVRAQAEECLVHLRKFAPTGSNTLRFLRAADECGIPWRLLAGNVYEVGQGVHARWLDSSFTDATSQIGAGLARDKQLAAQVLRAAGIPVPAHRLVSSVREALEAAGQLGYPVVVKPMDCDGGVGVAAGLTTPAQIEKAFAAACKHSKNVLVEKHVEGRDYRLTVLDGELLWAVERQPGGILGDGEHSVVELLTALNADPRRRVDSRAPLKPLPLDEEAQELLQASGLGLQSVVPAGQFIRLRRAANVASGGTPVAVMAQVHPHNRQLAERAAQALRLDLAGVDLLIPDIARSWQETGAAICEVNAQPQLGATTAPQLYGEILQKLLSGDGRIPITLVVADNPAELAALGQQLCADWQARGYCCGYADDEGVWLAEQQLAPAKAGLFEAGQMLLGHPQCQALVLLASPQAVLQCGLPFARCDLLILAGAGGPAATPLQREACRVLLPHAGQLLFANGSLHWQYFLDELGYSVTKHDIFFVADLAKAAGACMRNKLPG